MSSERPEGHRQQLPKFEPLPPTNLLNRLINKLLAPLFYLLFTIITAVVVVPVYTVIEQIKNGGRNSKGGRRFHREEAGEKRVNKAADLLDDYGKSYKGRNKREHGSKHE